MNRSADINPYNSNISIPSRYVCVLEAKYITLITPFFCLRIQLIIQIIIFEVLIRLQTISHQLITAYDQWSAHAQFAFFSLVSGYS